MNQAEGLSVQAQTVLYAIVGSVVGFIGLIAFVLLRAAKNLLWKPRKAHKSSRTKVLDKGASSSQSHHATPQPEKHSKQTPHKQPAGHSRASNKKQDESKVLEHPLYIFALKDHRDTVHGFGWAQDGSVVASACEDRCIRLFSFAKEIDKGIQTRQINIQGVPVDVGFLNDVNKLVVLCKGLLDTASLLYYANQPSDLGGTQWTCIKTVEKIFGADSPLRLETAWNPVASKMLIVACSATKEAKIYDANGSALASFAPNSFVNHDLAVSHNAALASIATFTADAKIWELKFAREGDFRGANKVMDLRGHKSKVMTVAFSMDAARAVSVSQDGVMKIWNVAVRYEVDEDPKCLLTVQLPLRDGEYYHRLAFGPDYCLAGALNDSIHFVDAKTGSVRQVIDRAHDGRITSLQWASTKLKCRKGSLRVLASSSRDKKIRMWCHPDDV